MTTKKNLVKNLFPIIPNFYHEVPAVVNAVREIPVGIFDNLRITSILDVDIRVEYIDHILKLAFIKKF